MAEFDPDLLEFYGTECVHCNEMAPIIEQLEDELGKKLTRYEVWHNEKNNQLFEGIDQGKCGGVPFFYNKKSGKWLCGSTSYAALKDWAMGK